MELKFALVLIDSNDAATPRMIIALSKSPGLSVIAERVETEEQYAFLAQHGQLNYQGYLFRTPLAVRRFRETRPSFLAAPPFKAGTRISQWTYA